MRVLTVRQPWAWALIYGSKDIENRTRNIAGSYRGPVAIHAGLTVDREAMESDLIETAWARRYGWGPATDGLFETGQIVGVVDLYATHGPNAGACACGPWAQPKAAHLGVRDPKPFGWMPDPIMAKGRLGLWRPDDALREQIEHALRNLDAIRAAS